MVFARLIVRQLLNRPFLVKVVKSLKVSVADISVDSFSIRFRNKEDLVFNTDDQESAIYT